MKSTACSVWIVFSLALAALTPVQAKEDEVRVSYPSKVESSKGKEREKLFSKWMTNQDALVYEEEKLKQGQQLIYFEYDSGRYLWRTIFTSKLKLNGQYSWWAFIDEKEMETKIKNEIKLGRQPAFIVRDNGAYAMMFVSPQDLEAVRKELKELGIGEPRLKK